MENIIHSFWSLPSNKDKTTEHDRNNGGFLSEKHHAMSWALSCLSWKKHYGRILLFTDIKGKEWLIDKLQLPYDEVNVCLDNINDVNPDFANYVGVSGGYSYANDFHLDAGSVGENAATDGSDIGLYGGIFPFSAIGADNGTPQIVDFTIATSTAPSGGTITIHLNANGSGQ